MEYQKIANLLNEASNKQSKFRTRNWVEINDGIRGAYSPNKQIRFKTAMLRSSLCDYSDAYILVKGNISVNDTAAASAAANNVAKKVIFKNYLQKIASAAASAADAGIHKKNLGIRL